MRILFKFVLVLLLVGAAWAQNTQTTGQVLDASGNRYCNATITANISFPGSTQAPKWNGYPLTTTTWSGNANSNAQFSLSLPDLGFVTPTAQYSFTICSTFLTQLGQPAPPCFYYQPSTIITGASVDITSQIQGAALPLPNNTCSMGGGGGGGGGSGPALSCTSPNAGPLVASNGNPGPAIKCDQLLTTDFLGHETGLQFNTVAPWNGEFQMTGAGTPPSSLPPHTSSWIAATNTPTSYRNAMPPAPGVVGQGLQLQSVTTDPTGTIIQQWNYGNFSGGGTGVPAAPTNSIQTNAGGGNFGSIPMVAPGSLLSSQGSNVPAFQTKPIYDARDQSFACNGVTDDTAALTALITIIGSAQAMIQFPANSKCVIGTATVPTNVALDFSPGSALQATTSDTITIKGGINNPDNHQIFFNANSGTTGTIDFTGNTQIKEVYPEWWGAVASGGTASGNTTAIQNAIYGAFGCGPVIACRTNGSLNYKWNKTLMLEGVYTINGQLNLYHVISFRIDCNGRNSAGIIQSASNTELFDGQSVAYGTVNNCSWESTASQDLSHPLVSLDYNTSQGVDIATQSISFWNNNWNGQGLAKIGVQISRSGGNAQGSNIHFYNNEAEAFTEAAYMVGAGSGGTATQLATNAVEIEWLGGDIQGSPAYGIEDFGGTQLQVMGTTMENGFGPNLGTATQTGYDYYCNNLPQGGLCVGKDIRSQSLFLFGGGPFVAYNDFSLDQASIPVPGAAGHLNDIIQGSQVAGHGEYYQVSTPGTYDGLTGRTASGGSSTTIIDAAGGLTTSHWVGWYVSITSGTGANAYCLVTANNTTTFTCAAGWVTDFQGISTSFTPDATTHFILEPQWGVNNGSGTVVWSALNRTEFGNSCYVVGGFYPGVGFNCGGAQSTFARGVQLTRQDWGGFVNSQTPLDVPLFVSHYEDIVVGAPSGGTGISLGSLGQSFLVRMTRWNRTGITGMLNPSWDEKGTTQSCWAFGNGSPGGAISDVCLGTDAPSPGTTAKTGRMLFRQNSSGTEFDAWYNPDGSWQMTAKHFSTLNTCNGTTEGSEAAVNDSTTNTYGGTITGGGTNHVHAYCNGTNWVVD